MLKKTRKQIITLGIVGMISAGGLFSGLGHVPVFAQEEIAVSEAEEAAGAEDAQTGESADKATESSKVNVSADTKNDEPVSDTSPDNTSAGEEIAPGSEEPVKQTEDNPNAAGDVSEKKEPAAEGQSDEAEEAGTGAADEGADKVKAEVNRAEFQLTVNRTLPDDLSWVFKDPSVLANTDIKLYKIDYSEYKKIIDDEGGIFGVTMGAIFMKLRDSAQLIEQWSAAEASHTVSLGKGDYYLAVNDSLFGMNNPRVYFNISDDGRTLREYDLSALEVNNIVSYREEMQNNNGVLSVGIDSVDLWAKYVDPVVITKSIDGHELTEGTEIEVYKREGETLSKVDLISRNSPGTLFDYEENGSPYINTFMKHPGTYVIRCIKAPAGYKKFPDITVETITNEAGYPEIKIASENKDNAVLKGLYGGMAFYYHRSSVPAAIEITLENENEVKADVRILTRADLRFFNLRHAGIENWAEVPAEYSIMDGVENKLYRLRFDTWKNTVEEVTATGGGGNAWIDNMRTAIKERGEYITSWVSSNAPYTVSLKPSVYAVFNDKIGGNGQVTFFQVYEDGSVRYCPEYYWTGSELGFDTYEWGKSGPVDEGNLVFHDIVYYENRDNVTFKLSDKNGENITNGAVIELFRKSGDKLTKVSVEKAKGGHYSEDHFCGLIDYPGEFVIKCVSAPAGYRPFSDISFSVTRNKDGYPEYKITDSNGNTVYLKGTDMYGEYDFPLYGAQETIAALFDIVLERDSNASGNISGHSSAAGNTATAQRASSGQVTAARTGDTGFGAVYYIVAGAAAATGIAAFALRKKRNSRG